MIKDKLKKIIAVLLISVISLSTCSTVFAQENDTGFSGIIPENIALKNAEVFNKFYETIDPDTAYTVDMKYDSQGRIIKFEAKSSDFIEVTEVSYSNDDSFSIDKTVSKIEEVQALNNIEILPMSGDTNYDSKMTDPAVKNRISEAQSVWNNVSEMRTLAHIEAEISRADYCVVYPKSSFATAFLENGKLKNDTAFRRVMQYKSPQMYGSDVMALQRALIAYGYLESTDVKPEEYGYFGPSTKAAVEDYQSEKGLTVDGSVGNNTIKKLFNAGSMNNKSQVSFEGLNKINVFRLKHDAVCTALAAKLGPTIYREAYIEDAGLKGRGGRADVIQVKGGTKRVWEIKPDSAYGKATGGKQVKSYVDNSKTYKNINREYCPLSYGTDITPFSFKWKDDKVVYVSSVCSDGHRDDGVVFYSDRKNGKPVWNPVNVPVVIPKPNEDYAKILWPEPQKVYEGMIAAGVVIATYYIVKGVIAIVLGGATGGAGFLILCF